MQWSFKFHGIPVLSGGPLTGNYIFETIEHHVGLTDNNGSEHAFDGRKTDLEVDFIFRKADLDYKEALLVEDGLVILAFLGVMDNAKKESNHLFKELGRVENIRQSVDFKGSRPAYSLNEFIKLERDAKFWAYQAA